MDALSERRPADPLAETAYHAEELDAERPNANPLSPTWFNERMRQVEEGRQREAFGGAYASLAGDGPAPFTEPSATDDSDLTFEEMNPGSDDIDAPWGSTALYRGIEVEVTDPSENGGTVWPDYERGSPLPDISRVVIRDFSAPETFEDVAMEVFDEAFDLMVARQRKYGPGNIETLGQYGVFTRMEDKMERIRRSFVGIIDRGIIRLEDPVFHADDTVDDADLDLMNYAAIRLIHRRGRWGKPLKEEVAT